MSDPSKLERRGLLLSIAGALGMAGLGIGFALLTGSDAVLLDGLFSLIGFAVGLIALRVSTLVLRSDDEHYHFGYAAYEPMLNLIKGLLMAFVSLFALVSAVDLMLRGGRTIAAGWAVFYAVLAAASCFAIATVQRGIARRTGSDLVAVDSKNWLIDGLLSSAVAVAFLVTFLLEGSSWAPLLPYADPAVVAMLVLLSAPIPARIVRDNWRQLLGRAPGEALRRQVRDAVAAAADDIAIDHPYLRIAQMGRLTYLQLYVVAPDEQLLRRLDEFREQLHSSLVGTIDKLALDVVFTRDDRWVRRSTGVDGPPR
jgi:predicted Co/Zn/Cd cation transporter (cation efflux family)